VGADRGDVVDEVRRRLDADAGAIREGIALTVVDNLRRMGEMGQMLVDHLRARHPDLPIRPALGGHGDPWAHLPPLSAPLQALVEAHAGGSRARCADAGGRVAPTPLPALETGSRS